jgi:predicted Fe-Mo cluster-binding NifX family protein
MGKRAFASFRRGGLEVWLTSAGTVRQAVDEARAGKLRKLTGSTACGGRGHRERHRNQTMPVDGDNT